MDMELCADYLLSKLAHQTVGQLCRHGTALCKTDVPSENFQ